MRTGVTHSYQFYVDGKPLGARRDVAGYNPDSYPKPGIPKGTLSEKKTITSKIYDGATADYWVYASPGVDPARPAALMVWQDGQGLVNGDLSALHLFTVTENLVAQKLLPPIVHVMISPAIDRNKRSLRSIQYDTVSDRFGKFLMEEVLPEVEKTYKLRPDGYSRAIAGESSGAICAFNVAWFFHGQIQPRAFRDRQLYVDPVASRRAHGRRQCLPVPHPARSRRRTSGSGRATAWRTSRISSEAGRYRRCSSRIRSR